jgi:hypothetical protein
MPPPPHRIIRVLGFVFCGWLGTTACVPVVTPRLPESVASALAEKPMRHTESENLILYYPDGRQDEARRFLAHVEVCASHLKRVAHVHNGIADQKMIVLMPDLPYNNAFVAPRTAGYDTEAVVPTHGTLDLFSLEMGQPPDPGVIACHEITHYVQFQQIAGFAWFWNAFGSVYTPQIGLDSWFDEGLAVYYETKLQPGSGRLAWPFWRGIFAAGYAGKRINGGDLSTFQRDAHNGNAYLVGSQFIRFLADRYGEDKLWKLIHVQARSIFFPLWVNVRFWQAYDKSLSTLLDEFADEVQANLKERPRPVDQRVIHAAGYSARYARAGDGSEALVTSDHDQPTRLQVFGPDGRLRAERNLTEVLPPRRLAAGVPSLISGISFTGDARALYFVSIDADPVYQAARLYRYDIAADALTVVHRDLQGTGGSLSPDGRTYMFARADGDHHDLATLDLTTGAIRVLSVEPQGAYVSHPRVSPDGKRIVATRFDGQRFGLALYDAASGRRTAVLATGDGPVHDPSWVDQNRIVYLGGSATNAGFQVYVRDLQTNRTDRVTSAPYLAFEPHVTSDARTVRFLNREGWAWTVDEVPLPAPVPVVLANAAPAADVTTSGTDAAAAPAGEADSTAATTTPDSATTGPAATIAATAKPPPPTATTTTVAEPPPPTLSSDEPYSPIDHLFVPRLYGPTAQTLGRRGLMFGLVLAGNDRLSKHRWAMAGYYQTAAGGAPSFQVGYSNRQLAPLTLTLTASQMQIHDVEPVPEGQTAPTNPPYTLFRRDRELNFDATRSFYENPIDLGFTFLETYRPDDAVVLVPLRRFAGPHLSASYEAVEGTAYTGARRGVAASGSFALYPDAWNSIAFTVRDARAELDTVFPLPLLQRHTMSISARARDLGGLPADEPFLMVGGYTNALLGRSANRPEKPADIRDIRHLLPPGFAFSEPLRGFEDYPFTTNRIAIADATYRYPFIIDRGTASTLGLLPAFFVRQIDFELFAAGAADATNNRRHLAVGGALTLNLALWVIPLNFQYQLARRTTDDQALVHLFTLQL